MAEPLTAQQFLDALRAEGLTVIEYPNWRTHNRNHKGPWGPVHGILQHHTASSGTASSVALCRNGYAELPGPLCHGVIDKQGVVHAIGYGRTNHAGGGDPNVLQAVIDERYNDRPPVPRVGNKNGVDGNARFYGFECINEGDGEDEWPAAQVEAMVRSSAALSRAHRWSEKSAIAHREWSSDKPDPAGPGMPTMPVFRARIKERLAHAPSWNPEDDPETDVTPQLTNLTRLEDVVLIPDVPYRIYWTTENTDEPNEHGAGGKTILDGGRYVATVALQFSTTLENHALDIYPVEEDSAGATLGMGTPAQIGGAEVNYPSVAVVGRVWHRWCMEVVNRGATSVTMTKADIVALTWPAA